MDRDVHEISRFFVSPPRPFPLSVCRGFTEFLIHKYLHFSSRIRRDSRVVVVGVVAGRTVEAFILIASWMVGCMAGRLCPGASHASSGLVQGLGVRPSSSAWAGPLGLLWASPRSTRWRKSACIPDDFSDALLYFFTCS